jgi:hypothetical protein
MCGRQWYGATGRVRALRLEQAEGPGALLLSAGYRSTGRALIGPSEDRAPYYRSWCTETGGTVTERCTPVTKHIHDGAALDV